jgi:hypothetical protein
MDLRTDIFKRIERKQAENREWMLKIRENNAYVQGLQDTLRVLSKDSSQSPAVSAAPAAADRALRHGTALAKTREIIRSAGKPLHITEILKALGKPIDRKNRANLSGTISAYARKSQIFSKSAPNTFGLIEMDDGGPLAGEKDGSEEDGEDQLLLNGNIQKA